MDISAVLFDLDETLFDHQYARLAALQAIRAIEPALARYPLAQLDRTFERLLAEIHFSLVLTGKISQAESRRRRMQQLLEEFRIDLPRKRVGELIATRWAAYRLHRRAVPGARALLRHLKDSGITVGVVTNNLLSEQEEKLRVTGLEDLVDELVCSEEVGVTKPDPRIFRVALERTRSTPRTAVMVGDMWDYDILGATRVGFRSVWFHRDSRPLPSSLVAEELRSFRPLVRAASVILRGRPEGRRPTAGRR